MKEFFGERLVESRVDLFHDQVALSVGRGDLAWRSCINYDESKVLHRAECLLFLGHLLTVEL